MDFEDDKTFYTVTMARLFTRQGRYDAAARIYRYLLERSPEQTDLKNALEAVLSMMPHGIEGWQELSGVIEQWVVLTLRQQSLRRLRRLRIRLTVNAGRT